MSRVGRLDFRRDGTFHGCHGGGGTEGEGEEGVEEGGVDGGERSRGGRPRNGGEGRVEGEGEDGGGVATEKSRSKMDKSLRGPRWAWEGAGRASEAGSGAGGERE